MTLYEQISQDITSAMKLKETTRVTTLRSIKLVLDKNIKENGPITSDVEQKELEKLAKQRNESISVFDQAGREELAAKERDELAIIKSYMLEDASEADIDTAIAVAMATFEAPSIKNMGAIMKTVKGSLSTKRVDGKILSDKIKSRLA